MIQIQYKFEGKEVKCPNCSNDEFRKGHKKIEPDGTEYFELICLNCKHRFMDIKIPYSALIGEGKKFTPKELTDLMIDSGLNVSMELAEDIAEHNGTTQLLIDILRTNKYWQKGEESDGWAPIHALHLLSAKKAAEAIPTIIDVLRYKPEDLGDWLTEEIASILANFGSAIKNHLMDFIKDGRNDEYARSAATNALMVIYFRDKDSNKELLRQPFLKEKIKEAFDKGLMDPDMIEWDDVEYAYESNEKKLFHDKDPMEHFSRDNINHLMEINYPESFEQSHKKRIGRNEPCPCGSGKKYKKCCMEKETFY